MAERDAFGREVGEDPLASLGWTPSSGTPGISGMPEPVEPGEPTRRDAAGVLRTPRTVRRPRVVRRSGNRGAGVLLAVVVLGVVAVVGAGAVAVVGVISDEIDPMQIPSGAGPEGGVAVSPGSGEDPPGTQPVGVRRGSLLLRTNFAAALRTLRERELGRVHSLRVAPERIDAQLLTSGGRLRNVQVRAGGTVEQFSVSGAGFGHLPTVPFARIDTAAPFRLTARAAGRLRRSADSIDYLVLSAPLGRPRWGAYFKGGAIFLADAGGRIQRRIG